MKMQISNIVLMISIGSTTNLALAESPQCLFEKAESYCSQAIQKMNAIKFGSISSADEDRSVQGMCAAARQKLSEAKTEISTIKDNCLKQVSRCQKTCGFYAVQPGVNPQIRQYHQRKAKWCKEAGKRVSDNYGNIFSRANPMLDTCQKNTSEVASHPANW